MKQVLRILACLLLLTGLTACGSPSPSPDVPAPAPSSQPEETPEQEEPPLVIQEDEPPEPAPADPHQPEEDKPAVAVVYFSATGTTRALAEYAADVTGGDLYEILPEQPYTSEDLDYGNPESRSSLEQNDAGARPALDGSFAGLEPYDIVFLGYPIWWGQAPRILCTFVESYDLSGKTVVPFCTSGSSGIGDSAENLQALASPDALWLAGERLDRDSSREDIAAWIDTLGLDLETE